MIIKKQSDKHWIIKTQKTKIVFNETSLIDDFEIPGDGEYEVGGVQAEVFNGIYTFYVEGMQIVFIKHDKKQFSQTEVKKLGDINILFLPVAGKDTMDTKSALKLISDIEPEIVIPIYYDDLSSFTKEEGINAKEVGELKINKEDLSSENRQVYILK